MEIIGFALLLALILWALWALFRQVGRAMIAGELAIMDNEREKSLEAVQKDPTAYQFRTVQGDCFIGPDGTIFSRDEVYSRAARNVQEWELRP